MTNNILAFKKYFKSSFGCYSIGIRTLELNFSIIFYKSSDLLKINKFPANANFDLPLKLLVLKFNFSIKAQEVKILSCFSAKVQFKTIII